MTVSIKAILLAAGLGSRLHPLTLKTPKCLVDINGEKILGRWLNTLEACQCEEVVVNTHYLSEQVDAFLESRAKSEMKISSSYEPHLLGTAGTLLKQRDMFNDCTGLLIHADNFTRIKLTDLIYAHQNRPKDCIMTMVTFTSKEPEKCGVVETDESNVVVRFHEKVENPPGNTANAAIYAFDNRLINKIITLGHNITDFSTEVLPRLTGQVYTYHTDEILIDIGTPDRLEEAKKLSKQRNTN